jgi:hypothetical protein
MDLKQEMQAFAGGFEPIMVTIHEAIADVTCGPSGANKAAKAINEGSAAIGTIDRLVGQCLQLATDAELAELLIQFLVSLRPRLAQAMSSLRSTLENPPEPKEDSEELEPEEVEIIEELRAEAQSAPAPAVTPPELPQVGEDDDEYDYEEEYVAEEEESVEEEEDIPSVLRQNGVVESPFGFVIRQPPVEENPPEEEGEDEAAERSAEASSSTSDEEEETEEQRTAMRQAAIAHLIGFRPSVFDP